MHTHKNMIGICLSFKLYNLQLLKLTCSTGHIRSSISLFLSKYGHIIHIFVTAICCRKHFAISLGHICAIMFQKQCVMLFCFYQLIFLSDFNKINICFSSYMYACMYYILKFRNKHWTVVKVRFLLQFYHTKDFLQLQNVTVLCIHFFYYYRSFTGTRQTL